MDKKLKHLERMKRVEKYIEENLDSELSLKKLSQIACYSSFHFHRIFSVYLGESVYAYKKRLLLERSVKQLIHSDISITQIAFAAGYENQPSFNKAFKNCFNTTPSECRLKKLSLTRSNLAIMEMKLMKAEMRSLKPISVLSVRKRGDYSTAAGEAWNILMKYTYSNRLMTKETELIGISHDDPSVTTPDNIRYDACVTNEQLADGEGEVVVNDIEGGLYAVFLHKGSYQNLKESYASIFHRWLPGSGYRLRELPPFEKYLNRNPSRTKPENLRTEIYIPVTKN
ncbi:AraC family transcriptional regulator [Aliikangiella coralliicola]|uniref:AraC family transcriptional regulator n=1 Tax=Aliikangiella coralliicola TaxID=2592383 RepID=A0A545U731_9GAMM|nr:AraC family transcriptional regulator [Aliikangiella coralliicola]TQV85286.1 AraC family transcriptional regulator [Aliikangiella coralliicola]